MNIVRHYKMLGLLWLMFGCGILAVSTVELYRILVVLGVNIVIESAIESTLTVFVVSFLTILSGWILLKQHRWRRVAISIISLIYIAYGFLFILFHGAEEEKTVTTIIVICLSVLGLYSFFFIFITGLRNDDTVV